MSFRLKLIALSFICSCTVLEDRDSCPCLLHLEFDESVSQVADSVRIWIKGEGFGFVAGLPSSLYPEGITVPVTSRSGVFITVMDSESAQESADGSLNIPSGCQCPEVYDFRSFCETSGETAHRHITLHKNHCRVYVTFREAASGGYSVKIDGGVCGYSSRGDFLDGDFSCAPQIDGEGRFVFCIPRQKDAGLNMGIGRGDGRTRVFALGNYIEESGYDWTAEDLGDVELEVDYAASVIRLRFEPWPESESEDIVI